MIYQQKIKLTRLIAPIFYSIHKSIKNNEDITYYDLDGGRGSTKSSFVGIEIVQGMIADYLKGIISHGVVIRQVANTLQDSVVEQIEWAINELGVSHLWKKKQKPLQWIYRPNAKNKQVIKFFGCDDPNKIKSIKFSYGYPKWMWFEEVQEFKKASDITTVILSIMRKNPGYEDARFVVFKTGNPKPELNHWWNIERKYQRADRICHHSDYTQVPQEWLTKAFLDEAEEMKKRNYKEYQNVFLGEVVGTDGLCYPMFDVNKHVVDIKNFEFKPHEKVARIVCGCDGGSVLDATTLNILLLTTANRIVRLPGFYYDPANWGHSPLANVVQVELMEYWLDYWLWYFKVDYCQDIKIVVDSASADLINQFNYSSKYHAVSTGAKDVIIDMRNLQNVYTVPNYFITVNAGYIDPISLPQKTSNGYASSNFKMLGDNDMLIVEELSLIMDEKTNKPVDGNDHMTDGMKYAIKGL